MVLIQKLKQPKKKLPTTTGLIKKTDHDGRITENKSKIPYTTNVVRKLIQIHVHHNKYLLATKSDKKTVLIYQNKNENEMKENKKKIN